MHVINGHHCAVMNQKDHRLKLMDSVRYDLSYEKIDYYAYNLLEHWLPSTFRSSVLFLIQREFGCPKCSNLNKCIECIEILNLRVFLKSFWIVFFKIISFWHYLLPISKVNKKYKMLRSLKHKSCTISQMPFQIKWQNSIPYKIFIALLQMIHT